MTFTHHAPGTPEEDWRLCVAQAKGIRRLQLPALLDLTVLVAHPDDETLIAGGLISAAAASGAQVEVIIASDGEASHPDSPTHTPQRLAARRQAEAVQAVNDLAANARLRFLHLPDGGVSGQQPQLLDALRGRRVPAGDGAEHWLVTTWIADRHPDHEACARAGAAYAQTHPATRWLQGPLWAWHWADPTEDLFGWHRCCQLNLPVEARTAKRRALARYCSQRQPLSDQPGDEPVVSEEMARHFDRPFELFIEDPR